MEPYVGDSEISKMGALRAAKAKSLLPFSETSESRFTRDTKSLILKDGAFCGTVLSGNFIVPGGINNDGYRIPSQASPSTS